MGRGAVAAALMLFSAGLAFGGEAAAKAPEKAPGGAGNPYAEALQLAEELKYSEAAAKLADLHRQLPNGYAASKAFARELARFEGMVPVKGGPFAFGGCAGAWAMPSTTKTIGDFFIDRCEVSIGDYFSVLDPEGKAGKVPARLADLPMRALTHDQALAYTVKVGKRLPTEEEWERAARGVDGRKYPWGNDETIATKVAARTQLDPVKRHEDEASPAGCLNMAGNVAEWTSSKDPDRDGWFIYRGGAKGQSEDRYRTFDRQAVVGTQKPDFIGFRCAADPIPQAKLKEFRDAIGK